MAKDKKAPAEVVGEETKVEQVAPNVEITEAPAAETKPEETPAEEAVVGNEQPKEDEAVAEEKTETTTEEVVQPSAEQPSDPTSGLEFERYWDIMSHSYKQRLVKK